MKSENMLIRVQSEEKEAFRQAAEIAGLPLSAWVRERLRRVTVRELEEAGQPISFIRARVK